MVAPYSPASHQQYQQNGNAQLQPLRSGHPMDNRATPGEYQPTTALPSTSYSGYGASHLDHPHAGEQSASSHHQQASSQDARSTYSNSATPTSETGTIYSSSARTPTFPADQIVGVQRYPDNAHRYPASSSSGGKIHPFAEIPSPQSNGT